MVEIGLLDDRRVELLHGEIVEIPPEGEPHAYFSIEYANTSWEKDSTLKYRIYAEVKYMKIAIKIDDDLLEQAIAMSDRRDTSVTHPLHLLPISCQHPLSFLQIE